MTTTPQHILVVEDDEMVQAFLALHLEIEGYTVTLAGNGAEMIKALSARHPDMIILDLNLPDGDGLSLAKQVRESSSVPIIIATTRKSQEDRLLGLGIGADDYLIKPFDPKELILRVHNLLERSKIAPSTSPVVKQLLGILTVTAALAAAFAGLFTYA
ncbi:MAG: response regulator transcription factor [Proteobacteria bacterium]|nr:response regulator transcription factor [Pseudomonadota bacterium]MDA1021861.1 response regulator transcription factor [Pseudomonadota bacterium]